MITSAILCIARNESPYAEEWLEYHFSIGIDRVYYVSTDSDFSRTRAFMDGCEFRSRIELLHFDDFRPGWQMRCYNAHLPLIEEDWILVIDVDEFLYLNVFLDLKEFLENIRCDIGQIQFPWLLLMSPNYCESRVFDILIRSTKHVSDHVKSMVRRECCSGLGIHSHGVRGLRNSLSSGQELPAMTKHSAFLKSPEYFGQHPFVLHFCSRGHLDVMNRIIDHQFFNTKNGQAERNRLSSYLTGVANWTNIPTRYMLTKFYSSLPTTTVQCSIGRTINSRTNLQDLENIFLRNIRSIVNLESQREATLPVHFENCYQLAQKLSGQNLSGMINLDDYLNCSSQLEYIHKLRNSLTNARTVQNPDSSTRSCPNRVGGT